MNTHHQHLLREIKKHSAQFSSQMSDTYLGTSHFRYPIITPALRDIAKTWMANNREMEVQNFVAVLTSLVEGKSLTEKSLAGMLLGYSTKHQRAFDPKIFDKWLDHLEGWAEIDGLCTGPYTITHLLTNWKAWHKLLTRFAKDRNIVKRRASLVLLCSATSKVKDERLKEAAFANILQLKSEKDVLITKAISWLLRSMIKLYRADVQRFLKENESTLPKIAVRETKVKLRTGKKTSKKVSS